MAHNPTEGMNGHLERITNVIGQEEKAKAISEHIIIIGNININMSDDVDRALGRTTKTLPIYQEIMEDNGQVILNKEKTRYAKN